MMKTLLTLAISLFSFAVFSQKQVLPLSAEFNYNDKSIQEAITGNKLQFILQNIDNTLQLDRFAETCGYYKNDMIVTIAPGQSGAGKLCTVNFLNMAKMSILNRLLISNGINEVTFDTKKMPTADFFKKFNAAK